MKKLFLALIIFGFCTAGLFAAEAIVLHTEGKVEVQKAGAWVALKAGDSVPKGAVISTGFKSSAVIKFQESSFTLDALTRITVEQLAVTSKTDESKLYLSTGKVKFDIKTSENKRAGFQVRSPVATASVRGTQGEFCADGRLTTTRGMVAHGKTTDSQPVVEEDKTDETAASDNETSNGHATPFTGVSEVGGSYGNAPVYAGMSTFVDPTTGFSTDVQTAKAQDSGLTIGNITLTDRENVSGTNSKEQSSGSQVKLTSVTITTEWE